MDMRTETELSRKVDLHRVLKDAYGVGSLAAGRLIHDGQVMIDGHVVLPCWAGGHWTVQQLAGRMLQIPNLSLAMRMFSGGR